jgi:hypothetical protein
LAANGSGSVEMRWTVGGTPAMVSSFGAVGLARTRSRAGGA